MERDRSPALASRLAPSSHRAPANHAVLAGLVALALMAAPSPLLAPSSHGQEPSAPGLPVVTLSTSPKRLVLRRGERIRLKVRVSVAPGYSISAEEHFGLKVEPRPGISAGEPLLPTPEKKYFAALGKEKALYRGLETFVIPLAAADQATADGALNITLSYQACRETTCLFPATASISLPYTVQPQ